MRTVLLIMAAALLAIGPALAQDDRYTVTTGDVSLSAAAYTVTIQRAAEPSKQVILETVKIYCSVACTVTQAFNGAAATATAGTVVKSPPTSTAQDFTFWTASNVGAGTAVYGITRIAAGEEKVFCLNVACGAGANVSLASNGTAANYSFTIASMTGTVNITAIVRQR